MNIRPRIAVTMGDPAGVGPEVCLHLLANETISREGVPVIFGHAAALERVAAATKMPMRAPIIREPDWKVKCNSITQPTILDLQAIADEELQPGKVSAATGRAGFTYVDRAIDADLAGEVLA